MNKKAKTIALTAALLTGGLMAQGCVTETEYTQLEHRSDILQARFKKANNVIALQKKQEEAARLAAAYAPKTAAPIPNIPSMPQVVATTPTVHAGIAVQAPALATPQAIQYTIQKRDSLWKLARRYYGTGRKWQIIRDANPGKIGANGEVRIGQVITIPAP